MIDHKWGNFLLITLFMENLPRLRGHSELPPERAGRNLEID
jgi:hypothetical protein